MWGMWGSLESSAAPDLAQTSGHAHRNPKHIGAKEKPHWVWPCWAEGRGDREVKERMGEELG